MIYTVYSRRLPRAKPSTINHNDRQKLDDISIRCESVHASILNYYILVAADLPRHERRGRSSCARSVVN